MSSALGGLHAATARFERAAGTIARGPVAADTPGNSIAQALGGKPLDRQIAGDTGGDVATAMIELRLAASSYKASIAAFRVADRMQEALLDITS